ncbi:hypothetical protein CR513_30294, partial [Mucuna pruriens]
MLQFVLHGYCASVHTLIGTKPFSLVYGMEVQTHFNQLNLIKGKMLNTICHSKLYQKRLKKAFKKKA